MVFMRSGWVLGLVVASAAWAQTSAPGADVEQVWLDPAGQGSLWVGTGRTLAAQDFRGGAAMSFTQGQLRSTSASSGSALVSSRLGVQVFGALGLTDWLEVSALIPVIVYQEGVRALGLASAGMGNPWLTGKVSLWGAAAPVSVAVALGLGLPAGTAAAQGNGGLEVMPRVQLGKRLSDWQLGAELGFLYRPVVDLSKVTGQLGDRVGGQVYLAGAVTSVSTSGARGELSVRLFAPLSGGAVGVEGLVGARWQVGSMELFGAVGPGFFGEPTTPSLRAYFGAAFANAR